MYKLKQNSIRLNPYHSSHKRYLVEKTPYEIKTEKLESLFKGMCRNIYNKICVFYHKINFFPLLKTTYNNFVYRDVVLNPYHKPKKNTFLRKVYRRRFIERQVIKMIPYVGFLSLPLSPFIIFSQSVYNKFSNRRVKKASQKLNKRHFKDFNRLYIFNLFSIKENARRLKKEASKIAIFNKIFFNKYALSTYIVIGSGFGFVTANPMPEGRDITNIFSERTNIQMTVHNTDSISGVMFGQSPINIYYKKKGNIEFFFPSDARFKGRSGRSLTNVRPNYNGLGNYIHSPSRSNRKWFNNIGIIQEKCKQSFHITNIKHMMGGDGRFTISTNRLSQPDRFLNIVYEDKGDIFLYYIKDYDRYHNNNTIKGSFICEVDKENSVVYRIKKIIKEI